ncbi:DUF202 domain-containing protein [Glycomyces sp. A-F 0318]|uniref:DUF202 domain-containing protein n=1 Tax=Glycomyces amatae TaxID=2881355 RepID=UPI001E500936|nr:DUF202 domain-containing protein [Glycomyces amatae]MCD0447310.1 DUF202 domain-containing protein [Glycomyces amatae]
MTAPLDPGLQAERTLLAWRRTCLAVGVVGVVAARFAAEALGAAAVALGALGAVLAAATHLAAMRRYRRARSRGAADARALGMLTAAVLAVGLGCGLYVLAGAWTR